MKNVPGSTIGQCLQRLLPENMGVLVRSSSALDWLTGGSIDLGVREAIVLVNDAAIADRPAFFRCDDVYCPRSIYTTASDGSECELFTLVYWMYEGL